MVTTHPRFPPPPRIYRDDRELKNAQQHKRRGKDRICFALIHGAAATGELLQEYDLHAAVKLAAGFGFVARHRPSCAVGDDLYPVQ